ncbi:TonB-dependent receptor [Croceicoccus sediminis]|uniref:TonB-dependent receptor n=1 Tax=Croceicoccus sediminis TaxID=2571150 RepID=UPI001183A514|nr:TonB-dependent receptor [Croceicoccus sediminis]
MSHKGKRGCFRASVSLAALTGLCGWSAPVLAQDDLAETGETATGGGFAEIIVTAQKRTQRLSDVGISIVAQTGEQLEAAGVTDALDLAKVTPGFTSAQSQNGFPIFSIRGVNFNSNQISAAPTVSAYVDEAALPLPAMTGALLLDVERIEILKGPQGTLFGQNATGGSINVIAAKPTSSLQAGGRGEVDNFGKVFVEGYVSGPLSDTVSVRLSGQTTQFGTWQYSRYNERENGDQNKSAARLLVDWDASPALRFSLNLNANYDHGEPQSAQFLQWALANPAGSPYPNYLDQEPSDKIRVADIPTTFDGPRNDHRQYQAVLRAELDLGDNAQITSISNYIDTKFRQINNFTGSFLPVFFVDNDAEATSFSQELRVNGTIPAADITYVVGANYQDLKPRNTLTYDLVRYTPFFPISDVVSGTLRESNETIAAFGNVDWEFVPDLTLTTGARYTEVTERYDACGWLPGPQILALFEQQLSPALRGLVSGLGPLPPGTFQPGECATLDSRGETPTFAPSREVGSEKDTNWSWRAGLNYKPDSDSLVYGLVSRGFKAGVYPAIVAPFSEQFEYVEQEKLTSYEVGAKASLLDRRLQLELAAFYYDYRNKQLYTYIRVPIFGPVATATNIPKSSVKGIDFSLRATPIDGWTISGGVTYAKSKIRVVDPETESYDLLNNQVDITGNRFNFAPDWSGVADTQYRFGASDELDGFFGGTVRFSSKSYSDLANSSLSTIPAYAVFDVRAGIESTKGWNLSVWSRNVTNKLYLSNIVTTGDAVVRYTGMPRTVGVSFGVEY